MLSRVSLAICVAALTTTTALASSPSGRSQARSFPQPPVLARAAIVMDATNGKVLAAVNPHLPLPMASTTKIMTALLALKLGNLSDQISVPSSAFNFESDATTMGLRPGEVVTLRNLLYGLMLPSGADAANTIAIHYAGSEARFVTMMNAEAEQLGMQDTHYANAHGLDAPGQYSSAYDLAILGQYVSYMSDLVKITSTRSYRWNGNTLTNVNKVLFWYPGIDGIKPGYTNIAGFCQVIDARRDGRHVVVAILHTPDLERDARNLLNFGLQDFSWVQSPLAGDGPGITESAPGYLYFPASGHYVRGAMLATYQHDGGPTALGFPRTEPLLEGQNWVQYFQNGALAGDGKGHVQRLALGLTPLPTQTLTTAPTPSPTAEPLQEGTLGTPTPTRPTPTRTPAPRQGTSTPTTSLTGSGSVRTASVFVSFQRAHSAALGLPVDPATQVRGYSIQIFAYGALAYDSKAHKVWMLPLGDQLLDMRGYLAPHPGNAYPQGFAPASVLRTLGWVPSLVAPVPTPAQ